MKVQIRDREALSSLSVGNLRSYLISRGWNDEGPWGNRPATIYTKEHGGRNWEILAPSRDTLGDHVECMAEAVAILAEVEDRSQLDVFYDLSAAGADVIRMRSVNGAAGKSLSLRQSAGLLDEAYNLLAAAARAAEKPRAVYRGRMSSAVAEYLGKVAPVPSYCEGYALTLHAPVLMGNGAIYKQNQKSPVGMGVREIFGDEDDSYAPFPRRATYTLARALNHANTAIAETIAGDAFEDYLFAKAVQYGVSANLCDSVAALAMMGQGIEIDIVWADGLPSDAAHFRFSEQSADILLRAAKFFRATRPYFRKHEEHHDPLLRSHR